MNGQVWKSFLVSFIDNMRFIQDTFQCKEMFDKVKKNEYC